MKAVIVQQKVYEGVMDFAHGGGHTVKRLVVPEAEKLAITLDGAQVFAFTGFQIHEDCEVLGDIDVDDDLINAALDFARAKSRLDALRERFAQLVERRP